MAFWTQPSLHPKTKSTFLVTFGTGFTLRNIKSIDKPSVEISKKEVKLINHHFNYPGIAKWQPIKMTFIDMNGAGDFGENTAFRGAPDTAKMLFHMLKNSGYYYPDPSSDLIYNTPNGHRLGLLQSDTIAADTTITSPEKSSTIANSFGDGLSATSNYDASQATPRAITIQQFGTSTSTNNVASFLVGTKQQVETWKLVNPIITNISWGNLSYEEDAFVEYTLEVSYDWAEFYTESMSFNEIINGDEFDSFDWEREYNANELANQRARQAEERRIEQNQIELRDWNRALNQSPQIEAARRRAQAAADAAPRITEGVGGVGDQYNSYVAAKFSEPER